MLPLVLFCPSAIAAADDFRFELVSTEHRAGPSAILELRLTDVRTASPVEGVVIFATRMDMEPDGMETMTSAVVALPAEAPGHYRFVSDLTMAGRWRLSIAAKVQGEPETVTGRIELEAKP
jgi:hypothetical protein